MTNKKANILPAQVIYIALTIFLIIILLLVFRNDVYFWFTNVAPSFNQTGSSNEIQLIGYNFADRDLNFYDGQDFFSIKDEKVFRDKIISEKKTIQEIEDFWYGKSGIVENIQLNSAIAKKILGDNIAEDNYCLSFGNPHENDDEFFESQDVVIFLTRSYPIHESGTCDNDAINGVFILDKNGKLWFSGTVPESLKYSLKKVSENRKQVYKDGEPLEIYVEGNKVLTNYYGFYEIGSFNIDGEFGIMKILPRDQLVRFSEDGELSQDLIDSLTYLNNKYFGEPSKICQGNLFDALCRGLFVNNEGRRFLQCYDDEICVYGTNKIDVTDKWPEITAMIKEKIDPLRTAKLSKPLTLTYLDKNRKPVKGNTFCLEKYPEGLVVDFNKPNPSSLCPIES